jgi:hypothetical protein
MPGKQAAEKGAGTDAASTPSNYLTIRDFTPDLSIRHPWPLEFSKMCVSCDMLVSVGKNSE